MALTDLERELPDFSHLRLKAALRQKLLIQLDRARGAVAHIRADDRDEFVAAFEEQIGRMKDGVAMLREIEALVEKAIDALAELRLKLAEGWLLPWVTVQKSANGLFRYVDELLEPEVDNQDFSTFAVGRETGLVASGLRA